MVRIPANSVPETQTLPVYTKSKNLSEVGQSHETLSALANRALGLGLLLFFRLKGIESGFTHNWDMWGRSLCMGVAMGAAQLGCNWRKYKVCPESGVYSVCSMILESSLLDRTGEFRSLKIKT